MKCANEYREYVKRRITDTIEYRYKHNEKRKHAKDVYINYICRKFFIQDIRLVEVCYDLFYDYSTMGTLDYSHYRKCMKRLNQSLYKITGFMS